MSEDRHKWWRETSEHYDRFIKKWGYVWNVYGADPDTLRSKEYLTQRTQGEHKQNFEERMQLALFIPLLSAIIDAYAGRIEEAEKKITRRFNRTVQQGEETVEEEGLGDPKDRSTLAGKLWSNIDGKGTNYVPFLTNVAVLLTAKREFYAITEGAKKDEDGSVIKEPYVKLIHPDAVLDTVEDEAGNVTEVKIRHFANDRDSIYEPNDKRERFTVYSLDGYAVYEVREVEEDVNGRTETKEEVFRVDGGTGDDPIPYGGEANDPFYWFDSPERNMPDRILPIFRVELPMKRYPAYTLATQNISFFNATSEVQNKHRLVNTPKLQVVADDEEQRQAQEDALTKGSSIIWITSDSNRDNEWKEPDGSTIEVGMKWLSWQLQMFLFTALKEYEDSARGAQKTATEAAQDAAQGEHSYLNMLASALDEFEMQAWKRLEQIEWPDEPEKWGQFHVERKKDFRPLDEEGEAARLKQTFFGSMPVPVGVKGKTNAAKRIADLEDVEVDEDQVMMAVQTEANRDAQFDALEAEMGL